jgi:hypothetical protein
MMHVRIVLCLLIATLMSTACGSQTPTPVAVPTATVRLDPRTTRPCDILPAAEASAIFGKPLRESAMGNVPDLTKANFIVCGYTTPSVPIAGFSFTVFGLRIAGSGQKIYEDNKARDTADGVFTPMSDFGDEAYWNGSLLWIRSGDLTVGVTAAKERGKPDLELTKTIARLVLERLE